jgi:hypothetical protein
MKKQTFFSSATSALTSGVGAFAAGQASGLLNMIPDNIHGAVFTVLGIAGESMVKNPQLKDFCRGVSTYGVLRLSAQAIRRPIPGLSGLDGDVGYVEFTDLGEIGGMEIDQELGEIYGMEIDQELGEIGGMEIDQELGEIGGMEIDQDLGNVDNLFSDISGLGRLDEVADVAEIAGLGELEDLGELDE